jgi:hypothetical protein
LAKNIVKDSVLVAGCQQRNATLTVICCIACTLPLGPALGLLSHLVELSSLLLVAASLLAILLSAGRMIVGGVLALLVVLSSISTSSQLRSITSSSFFVSSIDGLLATEAVATTSTP